MKKRRTENYGRLIALGVCTAIVGALAVSGTNLCRAATVSWVENGSDTAKIECKTLPNGDKMYFCHDGSGKNSFQETETAASDLVIQETAASYSEEAAYEDQRQDISAEAVEEAQAGYEETGGAGTASADATESSSYDYLNDSDYNIYMSLGMKWDEKKNYWTYKEKPVSVIWIKDGSFSTWGTVSDSASEKNSTCLYIYTTAKSDGEVTYKLEEKTEEEIFELFNARK